MISKNIKNSLFDLENKNIVITGSAGLLGSQYAQTLREYGANLILIDLDEKNNNKLKNKLESFSNNKIFCYKSDITDIEDVQLLSKQIKKDFNRIDGLINNAAFTTKAAVNESKIKYSTPFENFSFDIWQKSLAINLTGVYLCSQEFGKIMSKQKKGVIINISSIYGMVGADQRIYGNNKLNLPVSYAASKGAILNLTRYLAAYWHGQNIRVNTLTLGGVQDTRYQDKKFIEKYSEKTILGRMAKKHEYNGAILFLMSDASSYMTGSNLIVDGGWTAW